MKTQKHTKGWYNLSFSSLKLEPDNNGHMAQLSESKIMKESTSGAEGVENPEQLNLIISCLGFSLLKLIKSGLEKSSN